MSHEDRQRLPVTGGCLCRAVRFEISESPLWVSHCHCRSCRQVTGAAVATFAGFARSAFRVTHGEITGYASSPGVERGFCRRCGASLVYRTERRGDQVDVHIGALDHPEDFRPDDHVYYAERVPWFDTDDELVRHAGLAHQGSGSG